MGVFIGASALILVSGTPIGAANSPTEGPTGTVITVTVDSCATGTPFAALVAENGGPLGNNSGTLGSGVAHLTVPGTVAAGSILFVDSGCIPAAGGNPDPRPVHQFLVDGAGNAAQVSTPGGPVSISAPAGTTLSNVSDLTGAAIPPGGPAASALPLGLIGFTVSGVNPGSTIQVSYYADIPVGPNYWKYQNGAWSRFSGAQFTPASNLTKVVLTLTDGGAGDATGVDGVIVDPGGPSTVSSVTPPAASTPVPIALAPAFTG